MSGVLSFLMSGWIVFINLGYSSHFLSFWMKAWGLAWPAAMVISFIAGPAILKLAQKLAK
jgi:hypothetical protein|nr:DUF2798 domain-containing protein [Oceanobacter sp. 3_MG-2023]